jgi:hypothetical protein
MTTDGKTTEEKLRDAMRKNTPGLLAYDELVRLTEEKVIEGCKPDQVNGSSIDITLGRDSSSLNLFRKMKSASCPMRIGTHSLSGKLICPLIREAFS